MATATAATAIIHFVGLCVFTQPSAISPQMAKPHAARFDTVSSSHIVVILPRVTSHSSGPSMSTTAKTVTVPRPRTVEDVETHNAVIVFKACDYLGSKGWNPIDLMRTADDGSALLYVELDKDIITIQANGNNPPISLGGSGLPSLSAEVPANAPKALLPGYRPPYDAAAAVFDIAGGTLKTCRAKAQVRNADGTPIGGPSNRVDTEITLNNDGVLIFSAPGKSLKLKGTNTAVAIGNVPLHYARTLVGGYVPHYRVYCAMVGTTNPLLCKEPSAGAMNPCFDDYMIPPPPHDGSAAARQTARMTTPTPTPPTPTPTPTPSWPPILFYLVGPECSNTQYP